MDATGATLEKSSIPGKMEAELARDGRQDRQLGSFLPAAVLQSLALQSTLDQADSGKTPEHCWSDATNAKRESRIHRVQNKVTHNLYVVMCV